MKKEIYVALLAFPLLAAVFCAGCVFMVSRYAELTVQAARISVETMKINVHSVEQIDSCVEEKPKNMPESSV